MGQSKFGDVTDGRMEVLQICHLVVGQIHHLQTGELLPIKRQSNWFTCTCEVYTVKPLIMDTPKSLQWTKTFCPYLHNFISKEGATSDKCVHYSEVPLGLNLGFPQAIHFNDQLNISGFKTYILRDIKLMLMDEILAAMYERAWG